MATVTVSSNANLATLGHGSDDDAVITGAAVLTCNSDPTALPPLRSIRSSSPRASFVVRNTATAFSAGNLWKLSFTNPGSAIGAGNATLGFTSGATLDIRGEWLECYTATGVANETVLDASNVLGVDIDFPYFIEAETAAGSGVWKAVPVVVIGGSGGGFLTTVATAAFGTADVGRVLFYDWTTRLLKTGDGTNGSLFASGIKFRIPNIYVHLPAFTMTVAAGGWTTATGAQNVVSSTNAPTLAAGNVNWTMGVECFNISATPTGTTVTVNNRASDGTTATAHAAAQVMYALPNISATMPGRVDVNTNGNVILRKCWFGRWMMGRPNSGSVWDQEDTGFVSDSTTSGFNTNNMQSTTRLIRGVIYACIGRGNHVCLRSNSQAGPLYIDGVLMVGACSSVSTFSYNGGSSMLQLSGVYSLQSIDRVRVWRNGMTAAMASAQAGVLIQGSSPASGVWDGLEVVSANINIQTSNVKIKNLRYSQTNGALSTATDTVLSIGSGAISNDVIISDYDVITGGVAPYRAWFIFGGYSQRIYIHNKIAGSVRTVDGQARTLQLIQSFDGYANIIAAVTLSNMRSTGQSVIGGSVGLANTIRNVRAGMTSANITAQSQFLLDYPAAPVLLNQINAFSDSGTFFAAPNAGTGAAGGLYLGPVSRETSLDQFELTAGAYTSNDGNFYIETTGDAVLFKSPRRITGVSSITGSAVVYTAHSNITTGVTAEFRVCKWGDDITVVSWGSFTAGNVQTAFNALSGYTSAIGLNFQLRFTATTTVAGRFIRQCYVPCQMDTAYNPAVGAVSVAAVGAASGALMALYVGSSLWATTTISGSGAGSLQAPYDFDDVAVSGTLKIRALEAESIDLPVTWVGDGANVPAPMAALSGYTSGADTGVTWNKGTKTVTVTANMSTQDLWSRWRRFIVQLANFDAADTWSYPALDLADWNIVVSGADLTGNLTTTGTASQTSGGRFIGVVQASNGSSGVLTVTGLSAAQVYVEDDTAVQQDYQPSQTGTYTFPTPFGSTGTWKLVVNKQGYFPQVYPFDPQTSNEFQITLQALRNPDGTLLYQGGSYPEITVTFDTATNCVASFATEVTLQKLVDATQQAYSTSAGMAWLANSNSELTAAILSAGQFIFLPERTRLFGSGLNAALAAFAVSADGFVVDPDTDFPIRYVQPPSVAGSAEEIADAVLASLMATSGIPVNVKYVNDIQIKGVGTRNDPWNPV